MNGPAAQFLLIALLAVWAAAIKAFAAARVKRLADMGTACGAHEDRAVLWALRISGAAMLGLIMLL